MLFPNIKGFVDYVVIDVFVASKAWYENLVKIVFGRHLCSSQLMLWEEKKRRCCATCLCSMFGLHLVYVKEWLISNAQLKWWYNKDLRWKGKKIGHNSSQVWMKSKLNGSLHDNKGHIIHYWGKYPNMLLMGTKCCINYNPALTQWQFRYPIKESLALASLASEVLQQVRRTWGTWLAWKETPNHELWTKRSLIANGLQK